MLLLFWLLLFLVGTGLILLMPSLWGKHIYDTYRGRRSVKCPETQSPVVVRFDALRAAVTGLSGQPKLRLATCTRWPMRADCGQDCIPDAARVEAEAAVPVTESKRVPHLPVFLAATVTWLVGMVWHSQFVFRARWAAALGLTQQQTRELAWKWTPHLFTVAACLIFAYVVGGLLAWRGKRSSAWGALLALALWLVIALFIVVAESPIARDLLWIEGGYTFLGAGLTGVIVGGMPRRLFLRETE
jgi:Protein of unknown function (DUF1761)